MMSWNGSGLFGPVVLRNFLPRARRPRCGYKVGLQSWRRTHLAVWCSLFATSMGLMAILPVLTLYVEERFAIDDPGELTWWAGMIYGVAPLLAAICGPFWGALGDRVGKRPMAIRANLAIALSTTAMPFADTPLMLMLLRAVQGAFAGYVAPAMALVTQNAPVDRQGRTIAGLQVAMAMGLLVGPMVGGEMSLAFGRVSLFWLTAGLAVVAALLLMCFAHEDKVHVGEGTRPPFGADFREQISLLLHNRVFVVLLVLIFGQRLGQNMLEPFVALFVEQLGSARWVAALSRGPDQALERTIAVAFGVLAVAQLLFTWSWGRASDRFGPLRCLAVLSLVLAVLQVAMATVASIDAFLLLRALAAVFMAGSMTLSYASVTRRVAVERRTLAFSMVQSCMQFGFAFGPVLGGRIATIGATEEHANLRLPFQVAGVLCAVVGVGMLLLRRLPKVSFESCVS